MRLTHFLSHSLFISSYLFIFHGLLYNSMRLNNIFDLEPGSGLILHFLSFFMSPELIIVLPTFSLSLSVSSCYVLTIQSLPIQMLYCQCKYPLTFSKSLILLFKGTFAEPFAFLAPTWSQWVDCWHTIQLSLFTSSCGGALDFFLNIKNNVE